MSAADLIGYCHFAMQYSTRPALQSVAVVVVGYTKKKKAIQQKAFSLYILRCESLFLTSALQIGQYRQYRVSGTLTLLLYLFCNSQTEHSKEYSEKFEKATLFIDCIGTKLTFKY